MSNSSADVADTTAPTLVTPPTEEQAASGTLVFTFSEAIKLGSAYLFGHRLGSGQSYSFANSSGIVINGNTLTIRMGLPSETGGAYTIELKPGAVTDLAGNPAFAGATYTQSFHPGVSPTVLNVTGTPANERFLGSDQADGIDGGSGHDTINGYGGDDILNGGDDADPSVPGWDKIYGGDGNDSIRGGAGNDTLDGENGNDKVYGEAGYDHLYGGAGDDLLDGGADNDELYGGGGHDMLYGGEGGDRIVNSEGASGLLDGGNGDDALIGYGGSDYEGGAGNDRITITYRDNTRGVTTARGGDGDDEFTINLAPSPAGKTTLSGGAGRDTYTPGAGGGSGGSLPDVTITDFTPGAGGDLIDIGSLITNVLQGNPFDGGRLRLIASGSDTLLQLRHLATETYVTVLTLAGIAPAQVGKANIVGGYDPLGGPAGATLTGTSGPDALTGTALDDTILGLDGNDSLNGGEGNDVLDGGNGNDTLYGGDSPGKDTLRGGDGDDVLEANYFGENLLEGGRGNDRLRSYGGGNDVLNGGDGADHLVLMERTVGERGSTITLSGGAGDDVIDILLVNRAASVIASGGEGADRFTVGSHVAGRTVRILDFGSTDQLDLREWVPSNLSGNPFGPSGYLKAVQEGTDVAIYVDRGGAVSASPAGLMVTLVNVSLASLSSANFTGEYDPHGRDGAPSQQGTDGKDTLVGGALSDVLRGGAGDDFMLGADGDDFLYGEIGKDLLNGGAGNDRLDGGDGNDALTGGEGDDKLFGGEGNDALNGSEGNDELFGGDGNDSLSDDRGNNILYGGAGDDNIAGSADGYSMVYGEAGMDTLVVEGGSGVFDGGADSDLFHLAFGAGATGTVLLTGGTGSDRYQPSSASFGATVTVTDFETGANGDMLDLTGLVTPTSGNPFLPGGSLQLVQRGADTVLQTRVGAGPFQDALVLRGVDVEAMSSVNILYSYGNNNGLLYQGDDGADNLNGSTDDDILHGNAGDDILIGRTGNDRIDGGSGIDTAVFSGPRAQFKVAQGPEQEIFVSDLRTGGGDGNDTLLNVERLRFDDAAVALDKGASGNAGQAYRIYRAAFDREPDLGGLGFWIAKRDQGVTLQEMAAAFVTSDEFIKKYGATPSNAEIVGNFYRNILDRAPDQGGFDFYVSVLDRKAATLGAVLADISESVENRIAVAELIGNGILYQPYL